MSEHWRLSLSEGIRRIREGSLRSEEWVRSLLGRIEACEARVHAWAHVDREGALASARASDEKRKENLPLPGAPVAFKDIIDVKGMPREAGSPLCKGFVPEEDATVAARFRAAGAVLLGKAVTTQFATSDPSITRNPWNLTRSPGGSSSGSAAAVACGMVPAALGSQTGGSTLRPAAFCGVVGLKPSYGRVPRTGMVPVAWTLDHVGIITRTAEDAARVLFSLAGADGIDSQAPDVAVPDYAEESDPHRPARAFFLREDFLPLASPEVADRVAENVARLRVSGVRVEEGRLPVNFEELHAGHRIIMRVEAAAFHAHMFRENADAYAPQIRHNISTGLMVPAVHYVQALRLRARFAREMEKLMRRYDLVVLPAMVERPPLWEISTGNAAFNEPLTQAGLPAITLPLGRGEENLPIGIQLGGARYGEVGLLSAARWCEQELGWCAELPDLFMD